MLFSRSGPLFDGRALAEADLAAVAARKAVAEQGMRLAASYLSSSIQQSRTGRAVKSVTSTDHSISYQTGKYAMPVSVLDPVTDTVVTTSLATYGPWLEGTGSRNQSTRFKGYASFRRAAQELDGRAEILTEAEMSLAVD